MNGRSDGTRSDLDDVRRLLEREMPSHSDRSIQRFGEGWDNRLYLVGDNLIVRVAKSDGDSVRLLTEARTLLAIAGLLPLPVPVPLFVHERSDIFPRAAVGYQLIDGEPLPRDVPVDAIDQLASDLAPFLSVLHGLSPELARHLGLPVFEADEWLQHHRELVSISDPALRVGLDASTYRRFRAWWDDYQVGRDRREIPAALHPWRSCVRARAHRSGDISRAWRDRFR